VRYLIIQTVEAMTDLCQHMLARIRGILCDGYIDCIVKVGWYSPLTGAQPEKIRLDTARDCR
jgi:hypothetical protein